MVDIKRGDEWDFAQYAKPAKPEAKPARTEPSRVDRPAIIPAAGEPRSNFLAFEASVAAAIANKKTTRVYDIDAAAMDPKFTSRSARGMWVGYGK